MLTMYSVPESSKPAAARVQVQLLLFTNDNSGPTAYLGSGNLAAATP